MPNSWSLTLKPMKGHSLVNYSTGQQNLSGCQCVVGETALSYPIISSGHLLGTIEKQGRKNNTSG